MQWRPRALNLLPADEEKKIIENEREIRKKYELIDKERMVGLLDEKAKFKL